ncbi:MAG: DNA double-strand break repair nuclease NurA [Thermoplasmata archaeon]
MDLNDAMNSLIEKINIKKIELPTKIKKIHKDFNQNEISLENFRKIKDKDNLNFIYIDGGLGEILKVENIAMYIIRIAYVIYENERLENQKFNSFLIMDIEDDYININFVHDKNGFDLNKLNGKHKIKLTEPLFESMIFSYYSSIFMREAEKLYSIYITKRKMEENLNLDGIVLDGSLQSTGIMENSILNDINDFVYKENISLIGFSKSHSLKDENGISFNDIMNYVDKDGFCPCYISLGNIKSSDYDANVYMAKFKEHNPRSFRIDIFNEKDRIDKIMGTFLNYSENLYLPGYPYTLITVDTLARVRKDELIFLRDMIHSKIMREKPEIIYKLNIENIHDILNIVR